MKKIFYLRTYYQIIFALQMVNTLCKDDEVVFLISDDSEGAENVVEELSNLNILNDVILVKTKRLTYEKRVYEKIADLISVSLMKKNRYQKFLAQILDEKFDEFIFYNYGVDTVAFYNLLVRNNLNIRVSCIEEGILSYNLKFDINHGKTAEISYYIRKLLKRKNLKDNLEKFYCFYPILYKGLLTPIQVPRISIFSETSSILQRVFKPNTSEYVQKYIFFTSVYDFEGGKAIGEYELVCKVAELVGKDNLMIKTHPRDLRTVYRDNGFNVDRNSSIPWEVIQMGRDFSDNIFLTVNSGSVLAGSFMSEKPVKTFYMYNLCDISNNPSCQNSAKDIKALLSNKNMEGVLSNVSIANRLEDIIIG